VGGGCLNIKIRLFGLTLEMQSYNKYQIGSWTG
jgi:hypothetical protein